MMITINNIFWNKTYVYLYNGNVLINLLYIETYHISKLLPPVETFATRRNFCHPSKLLPPVETFATHRNFRGFAINKKIWQSVETSFDFDDRRNPLVIKK